MGIPYRESFGEDEYEPADWHYGAPGEETMVYRRIQDTIGYDPAGQRTCTCLRYEYAGTCNHLYRFRRQETIEVNEDYL